MTTITCPICGYSNASDQVDGHDLFRCLQCRGVSRIPPASAPLNDPVFDRACTQVLEAIAGLVGQLQTLAKETGNAQVYADGREYFRKLIDECGITDAQREHLGSRLLEMLDAWPEQTCLNQ